VLGSSLPIQTFVFDVDVSSECEARPAATALFWRVSDALNTSAFSRRRVPQLCALGCAPKDSKRNDPAAPFHREKKAECYDKYPEAADIVQDLRAAGAEVHFGVDATQLGKVASFKGGKWDRIVWNFPHAGLPSPISVSYFRLYDTDNLQAKALQTRIGIYFRTSYSFSGSSVLLLVSSEAGPSPKYFLRKSGNSRTTTMKQKKTKT
jgi:hypothetical protein